MRTHSQRTGELTLTIRPIASFLTGCYGLLQYDKLVAHLLHNDW